MSWYKEGSKEELDYSKPIMAFSSAYREYKYLLVPCKMVRGPEGGTYYNWLNIETGDYNSNVHWKTPQEAVKDYLSRGYTIKNVILSETIIE